MSSRQPGVQGAMAAVMRRMRVRRAPPLRPAATAMSGPSVFVSPVVKSIHARMLPSSSPLPLSRSASPSPEAVPWSSPAEFPDLSCTLRSFLQQMHVASPPAVCAANPVESMTEVPSGGSHISTRDLLLQYNPTLDSTIVQRVAGAVDIEGALQRARHLLHAIRDGGDLYKMLAALRESQPTPPMMQEVELEAGIAAKLCQGKDGHRSWRLRGFRLHTSDVQVAEVLPNGKIVSFTDPTLPNSAAVSRCCESARVDQQYLHFVLYKEGLSLREAFTLLGGACGVTCQVEDFAVNVALEESAVTVQLCSLRVSFPADLPPKEQRAAVLGNLLQVNLKPLRLSVQVLHWRSFPCNPFNSYRCRMQYSMLVRGITAGTTTNQSRLEGKVLAKLAAFPNYFGPRHFGPMPPQCPFRTYHAMAAWERNMPAEALVIAASLSDTATAMMADSWVGQLVGLLRRGEDRPAILREWYHLHVPCGLRAQIATSKAALVWNVLASCRIRELGENVLVEGSPEPGDFAMESDSNNILPSGMVAKPELFLETGFTDVNTTSIVKNHDDVRGSGRGRGMEGLQGMAAIFTREEAARYSLRDIVIPFNVRGNEVMEQLALLLGFQSSSGKFENHLWCEEVRCLPLFVTGSGYPRAARPWVKALPEPCGVVGGESEDAFYKLLTDMELRQRTSYTATSRGQRRGVWPVGKYGYRLAERLPAGAVSLTASDMAQNGTKCLALNFCLPAHAYSMAFFRELMVIEDHTASSSRVPSELRLVDAHRRSEGEENGTIEKASAALSDGDVVADGNLMDRRR
ncbi:hypothetical protein DQ04_02001010 [Trypanosoma grayi]|uniref:hypothetical protein n=1 Tax=Trypanosoma grayi TaxID=71804 RepID=UPI0004F45F94|nr:hypothetical protein DQ04_02001010 [Trypanosoma grayi]KEG12098.1 hypothetical protein DQ04_02001010 [Trypanosoma grayi]